MSSRRVRRLILLALAVGIGYWIYKDRPTLSGLVESVTRPILGSKAAVDTSERNRLVGDATTAISDQTDAMVAALHEGMSTSDVREILGEPDKVERQTVDGVEQERWSYAKVRRVLVARRGRVVSISVM